MLTLVLYPVHVDSGVQIEEVRFMYKRVLVALDGSERSGAAVAQAESVTDKVDGEITVVHVREMASSRVSGPVHLDEAARDRVVHEGAETLRAHGYTVREQTHATYKRPVVSDPSGRQAEQRRPDRHRTRPAPQPDRSGSRLDAPCAAAPSRVPSAGRSRQTEEDDQRSRRGVTGMGSGKPGGFAASAARIPGLNRNPAANHPSVRGGRELAAV